AGPNPVSAQMRSTPNGPEVNARNRSTITARLSAGSGDAPSTPNPPALVTAAASCSCAMNPIPAPTNGCRTPYSRVNRVSRAATSGGAPTARRSPSSITGSLDAADIASPSIYSSLEDQYTLRFGVLSTHVPQAAEPDVLRDTRAALDPA